MSFPMQDVSSRRSSGSPRPGEIEQDENQTRDTAGLTGYSIKTERSTKKQSSFTRIFADTWTLEILCWLLALVSLVIILIVLAKFNGQLLRNWHSGLSLNTFINVVSQIAQTAVFVPVAASISQLKWIWYSKSRPVGEMEAFDKASRGPIDSLWLIAKHPKWVLVYLGALNTSLILLLGPFAQQSISLPFKQRNLLPSSGSAPFALQYQAPTVSQTIAEDEGLTIGFRTVPDLMAVAVTNGLLTKDTISPSAIPAFCDTVNCTFPDYTSLAVCSAAEDVTPTIIGHCPHGYRDTEGGCLYTLPPLQEAPTARRDNFTIDDHGLPFLWIGASENQGANATLSPTLVQSGASPANLVEFYILFSSNTSVFSENSKANVTASLVALRITLSLCLKTYHTTVTNGQTNTTITDTQQAPDFSQNTLTQNATASAILSTTDTNGTEYWMDGITASALNSFLAVATFYGTYSGPLPDIPTLAIDVTSDAARAFGEIFYNNNPPKDHVAAIGPLLTNLETGMSNALRTTSDINANTLGTASIDEVHIEVDFRWLIVPILSIALSLVFLVLVMAETRKRDVPVWKDGLDHALFAIEPETRARMEGSVGGSNVGEGLEGVPVVLERERGRGWWLRGPGEEWWTRRDKDGGSKRQLGPLKGGFSVDLVR